MDLPPFLLDQWLAAHEFRTPPIRHNLGSSAGPRWTLRQLEALGEGNWSLVEIALGYAPPEGHVALRCAIADFLGVDPDWVVVTTGGSEALSILLCLAASPGGNVLLPSPCFPAFPAMAQAWRLGVRSYPLDRGQSFARKPGAILSLADDDTVLALVNTPHNPTGSVMPHDELRALAAGLAGRGVPLIVDEVFHPLYFGEPQRSAAGIDNVIVIGDMSKAMSLAGLRVGWIVDADPERRARIVNARSFFTVSNSPITEAIAAHALGNRTAILERLNAVTTANLARLAEVMDAASNILCWVRPSGGTMAYPWFRDGRDSRPFCQALADRGVLVVPGDCFGAPDHMRIGFGTEDQGFAEAAEILRQCLADTAR